MFLHVLVSSRLIGCRMNHEDIAAAGMGIRLQNAMGLQRQIETQGQRDSSSRNMQRGQHLPRLDQMVAPPSKTCPATASIK